MSGVDARSPSMRRSDGYTEKGQCGGKQSKRAVDDCPASFPCLGPGGGGAICYNVFMTKDQVKEILDRVLSWPADDQEKVARFVREVEQRRAGDDITDEEWKIIEERAARKDLATDEEVEEVFSRYRSA